jgi:hypothetical protein
MGTTKVDLRIDDDLLETVREIALSRFNAKVHHISHKPEVTGAINQLIRYGIEYLDKGYLDTNRDNPIVYPDNVVTKETLDSAIAELETNFKNQLGDFRSEVADVAVTEGRMRSAIAPLIEEIENLKKLDGIG